MKENLLELLKVLHFAPKENSINVYHKKYNDYTIAIDTASMSIGFASLIVFNDGDKHTQKITKDEDLVVLECVDRLLTKGYNPKNIILEKIYPSGHGTSGRLDILVTNDDNKAYMMIECKTWGKEFDKAFAKLQKDGGQLFTYFQQDKDANILVLYASQIENKTIQYINQIVKIEEEYRGTSNVKDFFERWNKLPKNNGVFDGWVTPYNFESKALTPDDLVEITQEDSSKIFNRFMEILRHNVVSDKPNAFNKIFTLFLCKIMDEKSTKANQQLDFQWLEGIDTHISFQKRLTDLYQRGMREFLDKEVTDLSDKEFEEKFGNLDNSIKDRLLEEFTKIRLQKNNEFAIKDVFDSETFEENAIVVKEIVELLQGYKIRYTKKQQFLSDFFELLLTTGLKQEVGQFFTPVPIAKFIIRSIPFDKIMQEKLTKGERDELLPNVIDYAVGSGHFITEAMDEIQRKLNRINPDDFITDTARKLKSWKEDHFDWAYDYVYGIEKDYRLVKTAKVGCYLHGDGLAKVIHGDGLSNFTTTKEYKAKLAHSDKNYPQDNKRFDIVISNPPYSVSAFKNVSKTYDGKDFELYNRLTDQSSEIEALFVERTKHLLKDGGIAGIILPSSILNKGGIYINAREIILKYFDIVSIVELGSNTFMATGTNTIILFLRRKNNMINQNIKISIDRLFDTQQDITINGVEKPLSKYLSYTWDISIEEYFNFINQNITDKIFKHDLYQEYSEKYTNLEDILELEKEKLLYFILAYSQQVTIIKTGDKKIEKQFLGYEFSFKRGDEGIHPIQRSKSIDACTSLYDEHSYMNPLKANSYIYSAFLDRKQKVDESLKEHISIFNLIDMINFDNVKFDKIISLNIKKDINIETKWKLVKLNDITKIESGGTPKSHVDEYWNGDINWATLVDTKEKYLYSTQRKITKLGLEKSNAKLLPINTIIFSSRATIGDISIAKVQTATNQGYKNFICDEKKIHYEYLYYILKKYTKEIILLAGGTTYKEISKTSISNFKIPLPPRDIQEKIINEIEALEEKATTVVIKNLNEQIESILDKYLK